MDDFKDLKQFIETNNAELLAILDSVRLSIINQSGVKILHSKYLSVLWEERPNKKLTFVLYFDESHIPNLNFDAIKINLASQIVNRLKTHRIIQVDNEFSIVSSVADNINHDSLIAVSRNRNVVFFFGEEGIDGIVRGEIFPRINVFYDETDRLKYSKNFHISELQECLKEYEKFINTPGVNEAFFASKKLISRLHPTNPPMNTLINKPENTLRNNLLLYLNKFTQHDFSKENELNNKRELDLYAEVDCKKYLIEVKWLGQTINDAETGFTQNTTDVDARKGVTQTLQYIQHLIENMSYNVHCGYLCVFDARDMKKPVNYNDFTFVEPELKPYFDHHFTKLDEISLDRNS